jgi:hypothetical protein
MIAANPAFVTGVYTLKAGYWKYLLKKVRVFSSLALLN